MSLQLRGGSPEPITVKLAGDAAVTVRPATAFEFDLAVARAGKLLAGLVQSRESAANAVDLLGAEFDEADFTSEGWLHAAAQRLMLIDLATQCVSGWTGIIDEAEQPIEKPTRATLALLLRSAITANLVEAAVRREVNKEIQEKNASAASPTGGAAAADNTAQNANAATPNVREG
jgi:hypothetical protein